MPASRKALATSDRHITLELKPGILPGRPKAQLKVQCAFAESHEEGNRRSIK